jgi:uncharacterized Zn finger protein
MKKFERSLRKVAQDKRLTRTRFLRVHNGKVYTITIEKGDKLNSPKGD